MSTEHPEGGQPAGQLSPDGNWRWDGHDWVPARQAPAPGAQHPFQQGQQGPQPQPQPQAQPQQPYAQQQPQYSQQQPYAQQPYGQQYGVMPPGAPPKKGLPTWAKILIGLLVLFVGLIALLTIVGLTMEEDYADWSCEDIAKEAVRISEEEEDAVLVLKDVSDLSVEEDNRKEFTPPEEGRGIVVSCSGTGEWDPLGDAPVTVTLEVGKDGEEWVGYEMTE